CVSFSSADFSNPRMIDRTAWAREISQYVLLVAEFALGQHRLYQRHLPRFKFVFPIPFDHRTSEPLAKPFARA
ncbi:MAG: hypothetical protein OXC54_03540, partial [Rhodospirillaceae bacterium]|nr:hypothetical protein [Rhodospirillaceae bacterium]